MTCQGDGTFGATTPMWTFENWSRTRSHVVPIRARPTKVQQLVASVVAAENVGGVIRAIGSGWSYPDTAIAPDVTFAIETDALAAVLTGTDATSPATLIPFALNDAARADPRHFVHVEAGIKVHALNVALDALGLAMITLGASNGQSVAGAIATGTHGSDADLRPIADTVRAIHLVGPGGQEWWLERAGARAITDPARMVQARDAGRLCPDIKIEYDDVLFNAVLVAVGRMGIVYSYVVEVTNAFRLKQLLREQAPWTAAARTIRDTIRDALAPGTSFVEIVVNPYKNAAGDHDCILTRRNPTAEPLSPSAAPQAVSFEGFCNLTTINALLDAVALALPPLFAAATATAVVGLSWMLLIPDGGLHYAAASTTAIAAATTTLVALEALILAARSASGTDLAQKVVSIVNTAVSLGQKQILPGLASMLLANQRNPSEPASVQQSFRMLTGQKTPHVPQPECLRRVNGLEFALDCSPGSEKLFRFLDDVFALTEEFLVTKSLPPALGLSLRFTRGTEALIGMQQFSRTCSVEFILLRGMNGEADFLQRLSLIAKAHDAIPHWGLIHQVDAAEVARLYGTRLRDWRFALGRLIDEGKGKESTFSTSFSVARGLEPAYEAALVISDNMGDAITTWDPTPQVEGSRTSQGVYLSNPSTRVAQVTAIRITATGDQPGAPVFTVKTALPFTVAAGQVFMVAVEFAPAQAGPVTGKVEIDGDNLHTPTVSVPLATSARSLGGRAELQFLPTSLDLGQVRVGTTGKTNLTLTNVGAYDAGIDLLLDPDPPSAPFAISTGSLRVTPGASDSISVSFTPTARGPVHASLVCNSRSGTDVSGATHRQRVEIPLAGTGRMPAILLAAGPRPVVQPPGGPGGGPLRPPSRPPRRAEHELQALDFGVAAPGSSLTASFWIRNEGDAPLALHGVRVETQGTVGLTNMPAFPATLAAGGELEVPCFLTTGASAGSRVTGKFHITSDDPLRPSVVLVANGLATGPHLTEPSGVYDLGDLTPPATASVTFGSDGSAPVTIRKIAFETGAAFVVSGAPLLPATLPPGTALTLAITVTATASGPYEDQLVVAHDGTGTAATESFLPLRCHVM